MDDTAYEIVKECEREEENCLYTSTTFFYWLKSLRRLRTFFIITPLLLGGFSGVKILTSSEIDWVKYIVGISALLAGIIPSIYSALKLDQKIEQVDSAASNYKIFQGKFRRLKNIDSKTSGFKDEFDQVIEQYEALKSASLTPPERFFARAKSKIDRGHYDFSVDIKNNNK
ncbi:MAG: SLATT domain-containing protein [Ignavibacteriales bacterium]|nr:SLATT domain-containing protein [Ignavibacteriales bacterium]